MASPGAAASFASTAVRMPRIFVYNNSNLQAFLTRPRSESDAKEWAFGRDLGGGFRATDTWSLASIAIYRLHYQRPDLLTSNPSLADLFVIPLVPRRPTYGTSSKFGDDFRFETAGMCNHLYRDNLAASYPHLSVESASRHVVLALHYTPILTFCALHPEGRYSSRPTSHKLLRKMRWLAHEDFEQPEVAPNAFFSWYPIAGTGGSVIVNVPFPSAVHTVAAIEEASRSTRRFLLAFTGSLNGSPQSRALRRAIARECERVGTPQCMLHTFKAGADLGSSGMLEAYRIKRAARFCAEPGGHNLIRKGVVDAWLSGCIPITFLEPHHLRRLWPHHLFGWRDEALLNIPPSRMLDGGGRADRPPRSEEPLLRLVDHLQAIPRERLDAMQQAVATHSRRLAYLSDAAYSGEDALDLLFKGLAFGLPGR
jgi:hypothetical protein